MKNLDKNQSNPVFVAQHQQILRMQQELASACLAQGLKLTSTVGREEGSVPYLQYAIAFNTDEPVVLHGQARQPNEQHYQTMFELINGGMVSEIFPPAIRTVPLDTDADGKGPTEEAISYWKRRLIVEHDITQRDPDPKASRTDGLHKVFSQTAWCGYNTKSEEIIRVTDGSANPGAANVDRVQYMEMGPRGTVVVVIYKDTQVLVAGQQGTFAEALKTAQVGFEQEGATSGGATLGTAPVTSLSLAASGASSASAGAISPISTLDLSGMGLKGVAKALDPNSALGKAVSRLSKGKPQPTYEAPLSCKLDQLIRSLGLLGSEVALRVATDMGVKNVSLSSKLNQDQIVTFAERFGFKVTRLDKGGAKATTTKAATPKLSVKVIDKSTKTAVKKAAVAPVKKPAVKKVTKATPATKRVTRTKPQTND